MRNKNFKISKTCYLCGLADADSKDHIPPKGLFSTSRQRLTLPAHQKCNESFSDDEVYFRDVIVQQSVAFKLNNTEEITSKIRRSWNSDGKKRYEELVSNSKPHFFKTPSGKLEKVIKISPDRKKLERIVVKIARGIIYNDTGAVTVSDDYHIAYIPSLSLLEIKERDRLDPYWQAMSLKECLHTIFGPHFGVRRVYIYSNDREVPIVTCFMGLILGSAYYIVMTEMIFTNIRNKQLQFISWK